tara:strand:+ start:642 stop:845 length:204 start_codon:yes stop_codon:yes gene_type:complete
MSKMSTQEENWHIMTTLGMPWSDTNKLSEEDRKFLMARVSEIHDFRDSQEASGPDKESGPRTRKVYK